MNKLYKIWFIAIIAFLLIVAVGCSENTSQNNTGSSTTTTPPENSEPEKEFSPKVPEISDKPVTISILNWNGLSEDEFQRYYVEPISAKHPNITLKLVAKESGAANESIAKHLMGGEFPDLVYVSNKDINNFILAEVIHNLDDLVKMYQVHLSRFLQVAVESLQGRTEDGGLLAIPWAQNAAGLFYNPAIFDKFGVAEPEDLMTWDEALQLARELTRLEDDVQYLGLNMSSLSQFAQSLSVSYVSPEGKALVDTPVWKRILDFYKSLYEIPGYMGSTGNLFGTKTVAMQPDWLGTTLINATKDPEFRWDVVGLPNFADYLGKGREIDVHTLAISVGSKNKEQALQVIQAVTSDEVQTGMSRYGRVPVLTDSRILAEFGAEIPSFVGKNWDAMFKVDPSEMREHSSPYDSLVLQQINTLNNRIRNGEHDINTLLREIQETADTALQEAMQ